ncbi:type II toxin-antitoxin system HicB family antitoxin [Undibacterium baiyunense]|uniref:Type II toxin-antitoxin system HicB family antitoxin n=1 Tax=Undibacterium baiyunense TaxID=2828731 RepID=A0A941I420_9BURK|nr:type II toxin-antitoxin system HicB family antitoxin [Undibacterium baiyunense]MBR7747470.1 type II toxin-antitoxin system HicB family antitoxin [Undibacterium baiyunense]
MKYPATFTPAPEGGFVVTFRDIPECITQGDDEKEAIEMAEDALLCSMDFYFEDGRQVPPPSKRKAGDRLISLPLSAAAKIHLLNEMLEQKVTASELARRLNTSPQVVNRLIDLKHTTKIDSINDALRALGKTLSLSLSAD